MEWVIKDASKNLTPPDEAEGLQTLHRSWFSPRCYDYYYYYYCYYYYYHHHQHHHHYYYYYYYYFYYYYY